MSNLWPILNYEIQMYIGARHLQGLRIPDANDNELTIQMSALTEVKALHIRILVDIFLKRKRADDLNIDDLLPNWRERHNALAQTLETAYKHDLHSGRSPRWYLNKFLAHPDKQRGSGFEWADVIKRIDLPLKAVLKTLPMDKDLLPALVYFRKYL